MKIVLKGDRHPNTWTNRWTKFATTRKNWLKGRFFENHGIKKCNIVNIQLGGNNL